MAAAVMGDGNGGSTTVMGDGGCSKMDGRTVAQWGCAASQLQWMVVAEMGNGREAAT
jgi:hypothetical protein